MKISILSNFILCLFIYFASTILGHLYVYGHTIDEVWQLLNIGIGTLLSIYFIIYKYIENKLQLSACFCYAIGIGFCLISYKYHPEPTHQFLTQLPLFIVYCCTVFMVFVIIRNYKDSFLHKLPWTILFSYEFCDILYFLYYKVFVPITPNFLRIKASHPNWSYKMVKDSYLNEISNSFPGALLSHLVPIIVILTAFFAIAIQLTRIFKGYQRILKHEHYSINHPAYDCQNYFLILYLPVNIWGYLLVFFKGSFGHMGLYKSGKIYKFRKGFYCESKFSSKLFINRQIGFFDLGNKYNIEMDIVVKRFIGIKWRPWSNCYTVTNKVLAVSEYKSIFDSFTP